MNMRNIMLPAGIFLLGTSLLAAPAFALGNSTKSFLDKASIANEFEIMSSRLALDKSDNRDVREFAERIIEDHTKAGEDMAEAISESNINIEPKKNLDRKHQKIMDRLNLLSGDTFDRQYISIQTNAHKEAINLFSSYAKNGKNRPIKEFAVNTLPTLEEHLKHVIDINQ